MSCRITGRLWPGLSAMNSSIEMSASSAATFTSMCCAVAIGFEIGLVGDIAQHQAEARRIADDVLDRQQLGHIVARFARHA